ncbi:hypothetical protein F4780DRAFT_71971 [Xylariomycetidae sp. FL0641]|nr:hypothetical protein F4780DRAFT_71971 [Xylariomycetidae sp. FL0641]
MYLCLSSASIGLIRSSVFSCFFPSTRCAQRTANRHRNLQVVGSVLPKQQLNGCVGCRFHRVHVENLQTTEARFLIYSTKRRIEWIR